MTTNLAIIVGKTFSGKTTIVKKIINEMPKTYQVTTHTTRPMRPTEDLMAYWWESEDGLEKRLNSSQEILAMREYDTEFGKWTYWTEVEDLFPDEDNIMILDLDGARDIYTKLQMNNEYHVEVYYLATSLDVIRERAVNSERGKTESPEETKRRIQSDIEDFYDLDKALEANGIEYKGQLVKLSEQINYTGLVNRYG